MYTYLKNTGVCLCLGFTVSLRQTLVLLMLLVLTAMTQAQESTYTTIDLKTAISKTINAHPELRTFALQAKMYAGYTQQAGISARPLVDFTVENALGTGEQSGFDNAQSTLSISWLLDGDLVKRKVKTAENYGSTVAIAREVKVLDLAAQTARYFIQALVNKERLTLAKLSLAQATASLFAIDRRVKAGKSSLIDKLKAQAEVDKRKLLVDDLTHEIDTSKYQLFAQWPQQDDTLLNNPLNNQLNNQVFKNSVLLGSLLSLPVSNDADFTLLFNKLAQTPSVKLFATKQRIAQSEIELARIETKPIWQFSTGIRRYEATNDFGLVAGVSIPFGETNQNKGKIKALSASQHQLATESTALVHKLNTQLYVLIEQLKHNQHVITTIADKIIPVLEQAFKEAEKAYNLGKYSYTDWMNTQQALLNAQSDLITAYQNVHLNNIEIERLTGASLTVINKAIKNKTANAPSNHTSVEK